MPHLSIEYSANLEAVCEIAALCACLRDAMVETGIFPLGGIRVRAFAARTYVIADGDPRYGFVHMTCRLGHGRSDTARSAAAETIYAAAERFLTDNAATMPLALSLDFDELSPLTSLKRHNTVHADLKAKSQ